MNLFSAMLCIVGIVAFVSIVNKGETETIIVCSLYSLILLFQALEMSRYWFQAKLLSKYTSVISVIAYALISLYRIYLLISGKSVYWFAISQALDYMIISIASLIIYKIVGKQNLSFSLRKGKEMFSVSKHYIVSGMMVAVFGHIGNVFLKLLMNESAVGYYTVAITCAGITNFIFVAIIDSARPTILESKKDNASTFHKKIIQLYSVIIFVTLVQSLGITLFAKPIVKILYGAEYISAILPLKIYTWQTTFSQIGTVRNIWILAEGKQKYLWIINLTGAIASIILNFALIPILGVNGAAISAVATQLFTNVIIGFFMKPIRENNSLIIRGANPKELFILIKAFSKNK